MFFSASLKSSVKADSVCIKPNGRFLTDFKASQEEFQFRKSLLDTNLSLLVTWPVQFKLAFCYTPQHFRKHPGPAHSALPRKAWVVRLLHHPVIWSMWDGPGATPHGAASLYYTPQEPDFWDISLFILTVQLSVLAIQEMTSFEGFSCGTVGASLSLHHYS